MDWMNDTESGDEEGWSNLKWTEQNTKQDPDAAESEDSWNQVWKATTSSTETESKESETEEDNKDKEVDTCGTCEKEDIVDKGGAETLKQQKEYNRTEKNKIRQQIDALLNDCPNNEARSHRWKRRTFTKRGSWKIQGERTDKLEKIAMTKFNIKGCRQERRTKAHGWQESSNRKSR